MSENSRRHPQVVNLSEVKSNTLEKGSRFGATTKWLGHANGAKGIGCSYVEVEPGRAAWPYHYHCANEEALYVLEGEGTLRIGGKDVPVRPGDFVTFHVGPDHAHQLTNTGKATLKYLALSTLIPVEVVGYPDSDKIGAMAAKVAYDKPMVRAIFKASSQVDYYDGEKVD
jgi:uncharacterized cupin superfamily protein